MNAEIITTGTELLLGEIVDSNSAWIARELTEVGVNLYYMVTVGDNRNRIAEVVATSLERSDVVLVTGGLGPTVDDVTREGVARATGRELFFHQESWDSMVSRFERWGKKLPENNARQAWMPVGCQVLSNPVGTAPGFLVESDRGTVITLPGVPREMMRMMTDHVLPYLRERAGDGTVIRRRVLRTVGVGESEIDRRLDDLMRRGNPTVGLAAHLGQTDVRITVRAESESRAEALLDEFDREVSDRLGRAIYSRTSGESLEQVLGARVREIGLQFDILESDPELPLAERWARVGSPSETSGDSEGYEGWSELRGSGFRSAEEMESFLVKASARRQEGAILVVLTSESGGLYQEDTGWTTLGFVGGGRSRVETLPFGGTDPVTRAWVGNRALDLARRVLGADFQPSD